MTYWCFFFFFKHKTAYEMRISDWSSDVCSSDLPDFVIRIPFGVEFEIVEVWKARQVEPARLEPPRHAGIEVEILLQAVARVGDPGELRFPARLLAIAQRRKGEVARRLGEIDILILARVTPAGGQGQTVGQVEIHMREGGVALVDRKSTRLNSSH